MIIYSKYNEDIIEQGLIILLTLIDGGEQMGTYSWTTAFEPIEIGEREQTNKFRNVTPTEFAQIVISDAIDKLSSQKLRRRLRKKMQKRWGLTTCVVCGGRKKA